MDYFSNYYHVFNRGVEKRNIFSDSRDYDRFILGMQEFNSLSASVDLRDIISGSRTSGKEKRRNELDGDQLVEIVAYCLNPNHYHLLLKEITEYGVSKFIQKLITGYTHYFNKKYDRSGALFQGKYKRVEIKSNPQLLYLSSYVNANYYIHKIDKFENWKYSSLAEYSGAKKNGFCDKNDIFKQFDENYENYIKFCKKNCDDIKNRRSFSQYLLE